MPAEGRIRRLPLARAAASRRSNRAESVKAPTEVTRKSRRLPARAAVDAHGLVAGAIRRRRRISWQRSGPARGQEAPWRGSLRGRFTSTATSSRFSMSPFCRPPRHACRCAVADQAELQVTRACAPPSAPRPMSLVVAAARATSCTRQRQAERPGVEGSAMHGVPKRVPEGLKIGSPVLPRPDGASPLGEVPAGSRSAPGIAELRQCHALALPGIGILPAAHGVAFGHDGLQVGEKNGEAPARGRTIASPPWS